jgi:hypothetical protein
VNTAHAKGEHLAHDDAAVRLAPLLTLARAAGNPALDPTAADEQREQLMNALAARRAFAPPSRRWMLAPLAAALALAAVLLVWPRSKELTYSIEGSLADGSYVQAGEHSSATLRFDEGSELVLDPSSRARVGAVTPHGATVVLENGRAHVSVHHVPGAAWTVHAGPFDIAVTGTKFDVAWSGEELDLELYEGTVTVRGPLVGGALDLHAGQRISAHAGGSLDVRPIASVTLGETSSTTVSSDRPSAPEAPISSSSAAPEASKPTVSWAQRAAAGDFRGVMDDADRLGIEVALASRSLEDLAALSDAARFSGRPEVARRALLAERSRFAGSGAATSAAFLLGRLSEDSFGQISEAISFYEQYLAEAPGGAFSAEALGREMMALKRSRGSTAAVPAATDYLARYPSGPYAAAATDIVSDHR